MYVNIGKDGVPLVEFIYLVITSTPGGATIAYSGLCCRVPCLSSAVISLYSLITISTV